MKQLKITNVKRFVIAGAVIFTIFIGTILYYNIAYLNRKAVDDARNLAEASYQKDIQYRKWASMHGGVYVPVTKETPPNPNLNVPERDIVTPSGKRLTLMNPAYMTRQVYEFSAAEQTIGGRIISLKPLRPENFPDEWEREALQKLEKGESVGYELTMMNGAEVLRYIRPFMTERSCLKCHAQQGYRLGDLRGAISLTVPLSMVTVHEQEDAIADMQMLGVVWIIGLGVLYMFGRMLRTEIHRRGQDEERFTMVTELSSDYIYIIDRSGTLIRANSAFYRHIGRTQDAAGTMNACDWNAHLSESECRALIAELFIAPRIVESVHRCGDGTTAIVEISVIPIRIDAEEYLYCSARDITKRKRDEEVVRRSEQLFRQIWEQSSEGMRLTNAEGIITKVNAAYCRIIGKSREDLEGQSLSVMFGPERKEEVESKHRDNFSLHRLQQNIQKRIVLWNGEQRWLDVSNSYVLTEGGQLQLLGIFRDITERVQQEQQLSLQSTALNAAVNSIVITDPDGSILWANPSFTSLTGFPVEEAVGKNPNDLLKSGIHPSSFYEVMWNTITSGKAWRGELINKRKDGSLYHEEQSITPVFNEDGRITNFIGIKQDITERKSHDERIKQNEENLRTYLNANPFGVFIADPSGNINDANPAALQMIGYSRDELISMKVVDIIPETSLPLVKEHFNDTMVKGGADGVMEMQRKDGSVFWVRVVAVKLSDGRGIAFAEDVTEKKRMQDQLQEKNRNLETLVSNLPGYIYRSLDTEDRSELLYVSDGVTRTIGYTTAELQGEGLQQFFDGIDVNDKDRNWRITKDAIAVGTDFEIEYAFTTKQANRMWLWERGRGVYDNDGRYLYTEGYVVDITARKTIEKRNEENEQKFRSYMNASPLGIIICSSTGTMEEVNPAGVQFFDYTAEELQGLHYASIFTEQHQPLCRQHFRNVLEHGYAVGEYLLQRKGGSTFWARVNAVKLEDGRMIAYMENITERKQLNEALSEQSGMLRTLVNNVPLGIWMLNGSGKLTFVNKVYCDSVGIPEERFLAVGHYSELYDEATAAACIASDRMALASAGHHLSHERVRFTDGNLHDLEITKVRLTDSEGTITGLIGISQDLTERKKAEQRTRVAERQLQSLYDQSAVGMVLSGVDTRFIKVNRKFCEMLGYQEWEFDALTIKDITHPHDRDLHNIPLQQLMRNEIESFSLEKRYIKKDRNIIWANISVSLIKNERNDPEYFATIVEDITQRKSFEAAIQNLAVLSSDQNELNTFDVIAKNFAEALHADCTVIGILSEDGNDIQTLAVNYDGKKTANFTFEMRSTPCELVMKDGYTYIRDNFPEIFPGRISHVHEGMKSYIGTVLTDARGTIVGLLIAMARKPLDTVEQYRTIHSLFAERTVNELVRLESDTTLQKSEEEFRFLVEESQDIVVRLDIKGIIRYCSPAITHVGGYDASAVIGRSFKEFFIDQEEVREGFYRMKMSVLNGISSRYEFQFRTKSGGSLWVESVGRGVTYQDGTIELQTILRDISERKHTESALKESERRFRGILEDVSLLSVILNDRGMIEMANEYLLKVTGYARNEVLGKSWFDLFVPEEFREELRSVYRSGLRNGETPGPFEMQVMTKAGGHLFVRWTNITMYDSAKRIIGITSLGEDITEQRKIQKELQEREEQYRSLITSMQQGIALHEMIFDAAGTPCDYRFIDVNPSFERITGLKRGDLIGRTVLDVMPRTERYWFEKYGHVVSTGEPLLYENYASDLGKYFEVIAYRPKEKQFATIITDVTERKRNEQKLLASERQYRLLAENASDVIWTMTLDGKFTYISPSVYQLRGFTPDEVMQQPLEEVICRDSIQIVVDGLQQLRNHADHDPGISYLNEIEQPCKNGSTVWTEVVTHGILDETGSVVEILGVSRDITARKRSEDLLKARLDLSEYATDHSVKELLQRILDVAEKITESSIGFFHFVEDDQKTISLQTWSTNTLLHMCHAEGDGQHYDIGTAGVWVDCVFARKPVVHNEFEQLTHRKGLPEGHAPIHRELLIPILRNEKVVGILGVGNKRYQYDQKDIEIANQLATMSWDILERRKAELDLLDHERALAGLSQAAVELLQMTALNTQEVMASALQKLGEGMDADRVYVFVNHSMGDDQPLFTLQYEWVRKGVTPAIGDPEMQGLNMPEKFPSIWHALSSGTTYNRLIEFVPPDEQPLLTGHSIQSLLLVPIAIDDELWGFLGVDAVRSSRRWNADNESVLSVAAESIGIAEQRIEAVFQLSEREQMLKFALDASGDGIWTYTIPTNEVYFSDEVKQLAGYGGIVMEDNFQFWLDHIHPDDRQEALRAMERHLLGESPIFSNEHRFLCSNGQYRWMLDRGKVLKWDKDGRPYQIFGTYSDIHQRKATEQQVRDLNEKLEQKVSERTQQLSESIQEMESFSYSISHDLRAPVRAIDSFTKILADEEERQLSAEGKRLLKTVRANTARMGHMIDDLLQFSRASRAEIKKSTFDLHAVVVKVLEESVVSEHHRVFRTVVHPLPKAYGDPSLLRQVAVNLISNAVKFTRNRNEAHIEIGGSEVNGMTTYWVKDNGTGFNMQYADKLFGVFHRLHNQQEFEGTGVGLAIVHRILKKHNGLIRAESTEGVGTTFTFTLPAETGA